LICVTQSAGGRSAFIGFENFVEAICNVALASLPLVRHANDHFKPERREQRNRRANALLSAEERVINGCAGFHEGYHYFDCHYLGVGGLAERRLSPTVGPVGWDQAATNRSSLAARR
jgi:hypothetical protein